MIACLATAAAAFAASDKDALMARDTAAWQAFKDKKADAFQKIVHADMVGIYADGIADMAKELSDMQKWDMKSFALSKYEVKAVGADMMMASYQVTIDGTKDGKDASGVFNAGSVWVKKNGEWQAIFHALAMVDGTAPAAQKRE